MKFHEPSVLVVAAVALAGSMVACRPETASKPPSTAAKPANPGADREASAASTPVQSAAVRPAHITVKRTAGDRPAFSPAFSGSRDEMQTFIGYHETIRLSPEQERLKVEALSAMPAPCCSRYSLATCCCPCNMAKAAWGLAAWLITEKGYDAEQVRQAEADWLKVGNPRGFSGDSCFSGGCTRPMRENGCAGMKQDSIVF